MASVQEQTKNLFSVDDYNEDDISTKSKIIKALDNPAFGKFRSKEEIIDKAKKTGTGLLTGTLAIPSDILSGAEMINTALADYANSPTAMVLKNAFKEASDKYGRPAFDKWFNKTTGLESNPNNVDQLIGEVLSPTGTFLSGTKLLKPVGKVGKQIVKDTKAFFDDMSGGDGGALATANNAPIQAIDETSKLLDKTKVTKPIETNIPALPSASELANKPIVNPTIVGTQTETGRKAEAIYDDLVAKGVTDPKEIFKKTGGGYVGSDGKFRFDLDDRDAVLKKNPKDFKFDVDSDGKVLETKTITLNNILKYDSIYKEYFKKLKIDGQEFDALKNIKVILNYGSDTEDVLSGSKTLGFYNLNKDYIQLNMKNLVSPTRNAQEQADYTMSTLIHEVQHAVQHRETFKNGTSVLDTKDVIFNAIDKDGYYSLPRGAYKKEIDIPYSINISSDKSYSVYQEAGSLEKAIEEGSNSKLINLGDNIFEDIINFTGDRKIEFLRNYEVLLDAKNRLDIYKPAYEKLKKVKPTEALLQYANDVFLTDTDFKKLKNSFGFKSENAFSQYVYADLKTADQLRSFVNRAYDRARVNIDINDTALAKLEKEQLRRYKQDTALLNYKRDIDNEAMRLYRTDYGEMEAQLVEQRYARRQELLRDSNLYTDDQITEKMLDDTGAIFKEPDVYGRTDKILGGFKKSQQLNINSNTPSSSINASVQKLESANVKPNNPALQKISKIAKIQDGPLGSRTKLDKDGLPENLLRDKDGKPLILYYGDKGYEFKRGADKKEVTKTPINEPAKLKNKFKGANFLTYGDSSGLPTNATYVTPNPMFASTYAMGSDRGSVIPIYVIADKVTDIGNKNFMAIDKAGAKADRGEVIIGNAGQDYNFQKEISQEMANAADKKYGTQQYVFKDGVQVFSALTGERLTNLPTINQNIRNKLLKLNQAEENTLLKKMSPKEQLQYKAKKSYIEDLDDEYFIEDMFKLDRKSDIVRNDKKRNLAKGGVTMDNQMEMFQDGGLKDEGGTIDPVSGNDVPSGSTQEEVRDDIPAQLSEGEFVFPADVVRFIGLEKLMMMRQEAKAGLQRMEEMGQMGNSDEATIPDDTPFDINDLEMEDDTVEMAQGGVIQAANGTFVNTAPNVMYNPSQFATGQNLPSQQNNPNTQPVSYNAPVYNPVPAGSYTPTYYNQLNQGNENIATFENLVGNNYGQYDEMREYKSESGLILKIPFKGGQPIYPIPEGYTFVDPEATKTEEVTVEAPKLRTTQVTQEDNNDSADQDRKDENVKNWGTENPQFINVGGEVDDRGRVSKSDQYSISKVVEGGFSVPGSISVARGLGEGFRSLVEGGLYDEEGKYEIGMKGIKTKAIFTGIELNNLFSIPDPRDKTKNKISITKTSKKIFKDIVTARVNQGSDIDVARTDAAIQRGRDILAAGKEGDASKGIAAYVDPDIEARITSLRRQQQDSNNNDNNDSFSSSPTSNQSDDVSVTSDDFSGFYNKGGLLGKKKSKTKKMKRGGLASR